MIKDMHIGNDTEIEKMGRNDFFLFYKNMYSYLKPAFPPIDPLNLQKLERASLLFFQSLLSFDNAIDKPQAPDFRNFIKDGFLLHELAIRELTDIFTSDSLFWKSFDLIKKKYFLALQIEDELINERKILSFDTFSKLAEGKSIFCTAAVDALCSITNDYSNEECLKNSILQLHIGFQFLDDIDDFSLDLKTNQPNLAVSMVRKYVQENGINISPENSISYHKLLFISGTATNILEMSIQSFEKAVLKLKNIPLIEYKEYVHNYIIKCKKLIISIGQALLKAEQKKKLSLNKITLSQQKSFKTKLNSTVELAYKFLYSQLDNDYLWRDFLTSMGQSSFWVTGYVGFFLSEIRCSNHLLKKVAANLSNAEFTSYNNEMIQDADSSSFCIGFLSQQDKPISDELIQNWIRHCNESGGWRTYLDINTLKKRLELPFDYSVTGWTKPHLCVTAAAANVLLHYKASFNDLLEKTLSFLANHQSLEGFWQSYWWTSPIYATSLALQAFVKAGNKYHSEITKSIEWLLSLQTKDGCWLNPYTNLPSAFYTALSIKALIVTRDSISNQAIEKGTNWLIENQYSDGSWQCQHILRIPSPDSENPELLKNWRKGSFGVNTIVDDHRRIFSTVTALNSLKTSSIFFNNDSK